MTRPFTPEPGTPADTFGIPHNATRTSPWVERASRRELPGKAFRGDARTRESLSDIIRRTMPPVMGGEVK